MKIPYLVVYDASGRYSGIFESDAAFEKYVKHVDKAKPIKVKKKKS